MQKTAKLKLNQQNDSWSCGVCAWASILRMEREELLTFLPKKVRLVNQYSEQIAGFEAPGVPMESFIPIAESKGLLVALFFLNNATLEVITAAIKGKEGILVHKKLHDYYHAVAWDGKTIYDSDKGIRTLEEVFNEGIDQFFHVFSVTPAKKEKKCPKRSTT